MTLILDSSYWIMLTTCYFAYNLCIVGSMISDAVKTSFAESGCTFLRAVTAFFFAMPLHVATIFFAWILPLWFPDAFRVGGERIYEKE